MANGEVTSMTRRDLLRGASATAAVLGLGMLAVEA
ncbi:twin-arginine translocation signal domain-containing protein [Granulicella sp. L46]